ncbi:hypothetical protein ECEC4402_5838, partial [Escherichia coli EC4402]
MIHHFHLGFTRGCI